MRMTLMQARVHAPEHRRVLRIARQGAREGNEAAEAPFRERDRKAAFDELRIGDDLARHVEAKIHRGIGHQHADAPRYSDEPEASIAWRAADGGREADVEELLDALR